MRLQARIDSLRKREQRLSGSIRPDPMAQSFPLGVGCMSNSQIKSHGKALDRTVRKAGELVQVRKDLAFYEARMEAVQAGECYENGQPCANSPKKVAVRETLSRYPEYFRSKVKVGDKALFFVNGTIVKITKLNKVTVSFNGEDEKWEYIDFHPLDDKGRIWGLSNVIADFGRWMKENKL